MSTTARGGAKSGEHTHDHDDRESLTHSSLENVDLDGLGLYVHDGEQFHLLSGFELWARFPHLGAS